MKICVFGLWHLGCVIAACLAERFATVGVDPDPRTVAGLNEGKAPIAEPGLDALIQTDLSSGRLRFTENLREAVEGADIVWIAFDTPVNEDDEADARFVETQIASAFPYLRSGSLVLISSQLPIGSTRRIARAYRDRYPEGDVHFAYSPENLRLGKAIQVFRKPERIVVGVDEPEERVRIGTLLAPFCENIIWMSIESAEMTKHALNAFLANSIVFINEIAALCEQTGADAGQVSQGLKSDERIGPRAYLGAGGAFAGGTLARDVSFLTKAATELGLNAPLLHSIRESNDLHKNWPRRTLEFLLGSLERKTVAVLGLTYKPGTDTLRRSAAVELCVWLYGRQASVRAFDPAVKCLPEELGRHIQLQTSAIEALKGADAAVVATEWPDFRELRAADLIGGMKTPIVVDANRFLAKSLEGAPPLRYVAVGQPKEAA
jgi:UDPglucose 6-dehydrogenase